MAYPYPTNTKTFNTNTDISGNPSFASYNNGQYFSYSRKNGAYYNIFLGYLDVNGNVLWSGFYSSFQPNRNAYTPFLITGLANDLYLTFVTDGYIQGAFSSGNLDCVIVRLDFRISGPIVIWKIQNASINFVLKDIQPTLAIDNINGYLYYAHTQVLQQRIISLQCLDLEGTILWTTYNSVRATQFSSIDYINNYSVDNQNPVIVTDNNNAVYLAYETGNLIDIVKFKTIYNGNDIYSYSFEWKMSIVEPSFLITNGFMIQPSLSFNNSVKLGFLTSGTMDGFNHTSSANDIVIYSISENGIIQWKKQGLPTNILIKNIHRFSLTALDSYVYISVLTNTLTSYDSVICWKLNNSGESVWKYGTQTEYTVVYTGGRNSILPNNGFSYKYTFLLPNKNFLFFSVLTNVKTLIYSYLTERQYQPDLDAFTFISFN